MLYNGVPAPIRINEVACLFGFERNYLDVNDMSKSDKLKLIGNAWCVHTGTQILRSLKEIYVCKEDNKEDKEDKEDNL